MKKIILLIAPMEEEFKAFKEHVSKSKSASYGGVEGIEFKIRSNYVFAIIGKVGKVNAAFTIGRIASAIPIKRIINCGTAGSLQEFVQPLDVVIATEVAYHDVDLTAFGYEYGQVPNFPAIFKTKESWLKNVDKIDSTVPIHKGLILSGDCFASKVNLSEKIQKYFHEPLAVDMEGGAIAQIATILNIPFIIIRSISDNINDENNHETHEELLELSAKHAASVTWHFINEEMTEE